MVVNSETKNCKSGGFGISHRLLNHLIDHEPAASNHIKSPLCLSCQVTILVPGLAEKDQHAYWGPRSADGLATLHLKPRVFKLDEIGNISTHTSAGNGDSVLNSRNMTGMVVNSSGRKALPIILPSISWNMTPMHQAQHWKDVISTYLTYGPHKAVAEVSNHNEPIGRKSESQLVRKSMDFTFSCFVLNWLTD